MEKSRVLRLMQESFDSMQRAGLLASAVVLSLDTTLLGSSVSLDSLGFVTFISDMEERISAETGREHYIILSDIQEGLGAESSSLTVGTLAEYIEKITE
jgi:hypothetical protein